MERILYVSTGALGAIFRVKRAVTIRFGHYKGKVRGSICRAMYSFLGHFNKSLFVKILSSNAILKVPRETTSSVIGGFVDDVDGPTLLAPAICLIPRVLGCEKGAVVRIRIPPDTRIRDCGHIVCSHMSSTSIGIATATRVTRVCVEGRRVFARQGVCPCIRTRSLHLSLLPELQEVTRGGDNRGRP